MPTGRLILPCPGGMTPGANAGFWQRAKSSGTVTNGVTPSTPRLALDPGSDGHMLWPLILPNDAAASPAPVLKIKWGSDSTSGNVILKAALAAVVDGTTDTDTFSFNAVSVSSATAVPGTSGVIAEMSLTPDATNVAAGRLLVVMLGRDADNGSDTATGNAWIVGAILEYTI